MAAIIQDHRKARLGSPDRALLDFAVKLTRTPWKVAETDIARLRSAGFDDETISDVVQVTALFAYYNRLADGLGVDLEPDFAPRPADCDA